MTVLWLFEWIIYSVSNFGNPSVLPEMNFKILIFSTCFVRDARQFMWHKSFQNSITIWDERFLLFVQTAYAYISPDLWVIQLPYSSNVRAKGANIWRWHCFHLAKLPQYLTPASQVGAPKRPFSSAPNISDIYELQFLVGVWLDNCSGNDASFMAKVTRHLNWVCTRTFQQCQ